MDSKKDIKGLKVKANEEEQERQIQLLKKRVRSEYIRICRLRRLKKAEQAQVGFGYCSNKGA